MGAIDPLWIWLVVQSSRTNELNDPSDGCGVFAWDAKRLLLTFQTLPLQALGVFAAGNTGAPKVQAPRVGRGQGVKQIEQIEIVRNPHDNQPKSPIWLVIPLVSPPGFKISLLQFPLQNRGCWHPKNLRFWRAILHPYFATKTKTWAGKHAKAIHFGHVWTVSQQVHDSVNGDPNPQHEVHKTSHFGHGTDFVEIRLATP